MHKSAENEGQVALKSAYEAPDMSFSSGKGTIGFKLYSKEDPSPVGAPVVMSYMVQLKDRSICCTGSSAAEAIACALHEVAQLARDGHLDPNEPERPGCPPIQHVMNILSDRVAWHIARRRESCDAVDKLPGQQDVYRDSARRFGPQDENIAALGTAIAALARIKDL